MVMWESDHLRFRRPCDVLRHPARAGDHRDQDQAAGNDPDISCARGDVHPQFRTGGRFADGGSENLRVHPAPPDFKDQVQSTGLSEPDRQRFLHTRP